MREDKIVKVPLELLEKLWIKLDDCTDIHSMGDAWKSKELSDLIKRLQDILEENNSRVVNE